MASCNGPYYDKSTRESVSNGHCHYPEPDSTFAPGAQIYPLAHGALEVHESNTDHQFAGLVKAATAAAGQNDRYHTNGIDLDRSGSNTPMTGEDTTSRKRKRRSEPHHVESEAKSIGEQYAAALFRSPAATSKKYTRPPMSKLYTSMELCPENFLQLQAAAKTYMLDPAHPERRDCVGQRGKGDSEAVKMKIWNTVARFLDEEGYGFSHFGEQVLGEQGSTRTMIWPQHKSKIIKTVIPLLRRMVTNERQRQYAVETRKGGSSTSSKRSQMPNTGQSLYEESRNPSERDPSTRADSLSVSKTESNMEGPQCDELRLRFNVIRDGRRLRPTFNLPAEECPDFQTLVLKVLPQLDGLSQEDLQISALLPSGLNRIRHDRDWVNALYTINEAEWMDSEMKVLIEADQASPASQFIL